VAATLLSRAAFMIVLPLAAAACGGSESTTIPGGTLDSQKLARAGQLTVEEFPPPWHALQAADDESGFAACPGVAAAFTRQRMARLSSPPFADGAGAQVKDSVGVYLAEADARGVMTVVASDEFSACLRTVIGGALQRSTDPGMKSGGGTITVTAVPAPRRGAARIARRVVATPIAGGVDRAQYVDVDVVREGRVVVTLLAQRLGGPPIIDRERLLGILVSRIRSANAT
jgi:hypothetical protein